MILILLLISLSLIPFFNWLGMDTREPKMILAVGLALVISLIAIYQGKLKSFKNKWLLILIAYTYLSTIFAPKPEFNLFDVNVGMFWVWQPMFYITVFFLMLVTVSSIELTVDNKTLILKTMSWVGFIMSIYVVLQYFGFEQFFNFNNKANNSVYKLHGSMGNILNMATFVAPIVPIALYLRKYIFALLMIIVICLTHSQVAIGALIFSLLFYFYINNKKAFFVVLTGALILCAFKVNCYIKTKSFNDDHGRFEVWQNIVTDLKNPLHKDKNDRYPLTGFGLGSFKYVFHIKHPNTKGYGGFQQAHNEYLEWLYNTGFIGVFLFLASIWQVIKSGLTKDKLKTALLSSFLCIAICAGGWIVFQLGANIFYAVTIAGLLHNQA